MYCCFIFEEDEKINYDLRHAVDNDQQEHDHVEQRGAHVLQKLHSYLQIHMRLRLKNCTTASFVGQYAQV